MIKWAKIHQAVMIVENKHIDEWFDNPSIYNYNENKGIHEWYDLKLVIYNRSMGHSGNN